MAIKKRHFSLCFYVTLAVVACGAFWWKLVSALNFRNVGLTEDSVTARAEKASESDVERKRKEYAQMQAQLEAEKLKLEEQKYKADIQCRTALFQSKIEAAYERFVGQIPFADAHLSIETAHAGVKVLASEDGLCGYKALSTMTYKVAYDKIKGTNTLEEFVNPLMERHVMTNIRDAVEVYKKKLVSFQKEMECEMTAYQADVLLRGQALKSFASQLTALKPAVMKGSQDKIAAFNSKTEEMAEATAGAVVGIVAEVAFMRSTIESVNVVGKRMIVTLLAKTAARCGASYAVGGGAAVADGPLPIGDIIGLGLALGGTAWTAYDIYKLKSVVPKEIEKNLCGYVNEIDAGLRDNAIEKAKAMLTEMKKMAAEQMKGL